MIVRALCDICGDEASRQGYDNLDYCARCWLNSELCGLDRQREDAQKVVDYHLKRLAELDEKRVRLRRELEGLPPA